MRFLYTVIKENKRACKEFNLYGFVVKFWWLNKWYAKLVVKKISCFLFCQYILSILLFANIYYLYYNQLFHFIIYIYIYILFAKCFIHSLCRKLWNTTEIFVRLKNKGALCLKQFLATESPLKMMKNAFYFTLKSLFVLKIFKFLSWLSFWPCRKAAWLK